MVQGSVSVSHGVLNQTPMGLRAGVLARSGVAEVANVADGVKARAPLGYDSTGFLFLVSTFPLPGSGSALFFCLVALGDGSVSVQNVQRCVMPLLFGNRKQHRPAITWMHRAACH